MPIEAIVFDFDGVIIDTETPDFATWQQEFRVQGVELSRELWSGYIGASIGSFDIYSHLEELTGRGLDRDEVGARRRRRYLDQVNANPLLPGVMDYLTTARRLGIRVGIASNSTREWVEGHVEHRGLGAYIDAIKTRDDVRAVKPAPDVYVAALDAVGVPPARAVAVEDSLTGAAAAVAAGLFCVVVPNGMTESMGFGRFDLRLGSLAEMALPDLVDVASGREGGSV